VSAKDATTSTPAAAAAETKTAAAAPARPAAKATDRPQAKNGNNWFKKLLKKLGI